MSRMNDVNQPHQHDAADLAEVTKLCHEYSSERANFHKFGFQCLLKKLKEIEKIVLTISKLSRNNGPQIQSDTANVFKNVVANEANSSPHLGLIADDVRLPEEITFHSKRILHTIFEKFEVHINDFASKLKIKLHETLNESYCEMETTVNDLNQQQKMDAKNLIEVLLNADIECFEENLPINEAIVLNGQLRSSDNAEKLLLPQDLTPFTRSALNDIFKSYEVNVSDFAEKIKAQIYDGLNGMYDQFEFNINKLIDEKKLQLRCNLEGIFDQPQSLRLTDVAKLNDGQCVPFDTQLARHFQDLSRLVGAILEKKDDDSAAIIDNVHGSLESHDGQDDTQYMGLPPLSSKKRGRLCKR